MKSRHEVARTPLKTPLVGRTPWSAADALVGLLASRRNSIQWATAGPGGPARTRGSAPLCLCSRPFSCRFLPLVLLLSSCGYRVAGHADLVPKTIKTIAIPAFGNQTVHQKLSQLISEDLTREFISRTRYTIVSVPDNADALLTGSVLQYSSGGTIYDPVTGRATGGQIIVVLQVSLTDRHTGKTIFSRPRYEFRERYEISIDPQAYFDESGTAIIRLSRDVAHSVVTAILVDF